jgi:hypothetical protein
MPNVAERYVLLDQKVFGLLKIKSHNFYYTPMCTNGRQHMGKSFVGLICPLLVHVP